MKLGFLPTRRNILSKEAAGAHKRAIEQYIKSRGIDYVNLDWLNDEGLIFSGTDAKTVADRFKAEGVDAVFAAHCNFGTEDAVAKVTSILKKPVLLWGPRDPAPEESGLRTFDTQCGMFASSKVIKRLGCEFTYIINSSLEDAVFTRGFDNFLSATSVVKAFSQMRIGQIGTRPGLFWSVICNEGELLERFGIQTEAVTLTEITERAKKIAAENSAVLKDEMEKVKSRVGYIEFDDDGLRRSIGLKLAIRRWADEQGLSAVAMQCWSSLQKQINLAPCFINGELTGEGLPVVCETDIHGAITSVMLQAAGMGSTPTFFADLTIRHPDNDNSELLWHCGNFPHALSKQNTYNGTTNHFDMFIPAAGDFELKSGDITVCRFDGAEGDYRLLMGQGKSTDGPRSKGTYLWLEVPDWPLWEERFMYGPYIHHLAGIHGKYAPALYEACKYIPGLKPDPVQPDESEIRAWLRGNDLGATRD